MSEMSASAPNATLHSAPQSPRRLRLLLGVAVAALALTAIVGWLTRADALFMELAAAAFAMCF